jgi:hypothetical protein
MTARFTRDANASAADLREAYVRDRTTIEGERADIRFEGFR